MPDTPDTPPEFVRDDDFASLYANNVRFEASVWDLKTIYGQLDQSKNPNVIEQHTAVAIPWVQAKLCAYFLAVNIIIHQSEIGFIPVPSRVLPPRPDPDGPGLDDNGRKVVKYLAWVYDQFFSDKPYVPPGLEGDSPSPRL